MLYRARVRWRVFERTSGGFLRPARLYLNCLSDDLMRRVRDFPANWSELSDDARFELSWWR